MQDVEVNEGSSGEFSSRFAIQAERVRQSGLLGRSDPLRRLLDFLISRAGQPEAPKEVEIAEALGREYSYEVGLDASIRVYVHRLRKKLDDYYASQPEGCDRLSIPRGSYRLALEMRDAPRSVDAFATEPPAPILAPEPVMAIVPVRAQRARWRIFLAGMAAALGLSGLSLGAQYAWSHRADNPHRIVETTMWHPFIGTMFKTIYVIGDSDGHDGDTLVPMSSTRALARVLPVIGPLLGGDAPSMVTGTAFLAPSFVKEDNIILIGSFAHMGILADTIFPQSGLSAPDAAGTVTDKRSGRRYVSAAPPYGEHQEQVSYGYLACLQGPSGNRIVVISGATGAAVMRMTEVALNPVKLDAISAQGGKDFEALFAVSTLNGENVSDQLELVRPFRTSPPRR